MSQYYIPEEVHFYLQDEISYPSNQGPRPSLSFAR
jgi:hypothetical protein